MFKSVKRTVSSVHFVMLTSILDDVKGKVCRQNFAMIRGVDKYKGSGAF